VSMPTLTLTFKGIWQASSRASTQNCSVPLTYFSCKAMGDWPLLTGFLEAKQSYQDQLEESLAMLSQLRMLTKNRVVFLANKHLLALIWGEHRLTSVGLTALMNIFLKQKFLELVSKLLNLT